MSKEKLLRELQELLDELFTPAISEKLDQIRKRGSIK